MNKEVRKYMAEIGRKGGLVKSETKLAHLKKLNEQRRAQKKLNETENIEYEDLKK